MRLLPVLLAATFLLSSAAGAAPNNAQQPTAQQAEEIQGIYVLSDGRRAHISSINGRIYVAIASGQQKELLAVGQNRFASRSGDMIIELQPGSDGDKIVLQQMRATSGDAPVRLASVTHPGRGSLD